MGAAGAAAPDAIPEPRVLVEAVQTVTPARPAGARSPRRILASSEKALLEAMQGRACAVLAYGDPVDDATGYNLAGRLKESLNAALSEHPVVAGRLRCREDGGVEVRFTDSGVRLVQARAGRGCMEELLGAAGAAAAGELVYWEDVEEESFQYSPLFFVQLTIFEGEGYTIGLSGSLLAADPLLLSSFLATWSAIHARMSFSDPSIFHLSKFRALLRPHPLSARRHRSHRTFFFSSSLDLQQPFTLFRSDPSGDLSVEAREGTTTPPASCGAEDVGWVERAGLGNVGFETGARPVRVLCFLQTCNGKGMAVEMPPTEGCEGRPVAVALPEVAVGM